MKDFTCVVSAFRESEPGGLTWLHCVHVKAHSIKGAKRAAVDLLQEGMEGSTFTVDFVFEGKISPVYA